MRCLVFAALVTVAACGSDSTGPAGARGQLDHLTLTQPETTFTVGDSAGSTYDLAAHWKAFDSSGTKLEVRTLRLSYTHRGCRRPATVGARWQVHHHRAVHRLHLHLRRDEPRLV